MRNLLRVAFMLLAVAVCRGSITSQIDQSPPYTVLGLPSTVPVGFPFQQGSDLRAYDIGSISVPRSPATLLSLGSDYTVTGGGYNSANQMQVGSIQVVTTGIGAIIPNDQIVIMRGVPVNQITSFTSTGPLIINLIEQALDKQATLSQQVNQAAASALHFEPQESLSTLLSKSARASTVLTFDALGQVNLLPISTTSTPTDISNDLVTSTGSPTPRTLATRFSVPLNVKDWGAKGDGATDDTTAIQNALNYCAANSSPKLVFPPGTYIVSSMLFFGSGSGSANPLQVGFTIEGAGKSAMFPAITYPSGGTTIVYNGAVGSAFSIFEVGDFTAWRYFTMQNISLGCSTVNGATNGVTILGGKGRGFTFKEVQVNQVHVAFNVSCTTGASGNGEFNRFDHCEAQYVDTFFSTNNSQAEETSLADCFCALFNSGGTSAFIINNAGTQGAGIQIRNFSASWPSGSTGNTLLNLNAVGEPISYIGGRVEWCNRYVTVQDTAEATNGAAINFQAVDFDGMDNGQDVVYPGVSNAAGIYRLNFKGCGFGQNNAAANPRRIGVNVSAKSGVSGIQVHFDECRFSNLYFDTAYNSVYNDQLAVPPPMEWKDCSITFGVMNSGQQTMNFSKRYDPVSRSAANADLPAGAVHSGYPTNYLLQSNFTASNGSNITATTPWVHTGTSSFATVNRWPNITLSSSPNFVATAINASSTVYQDVTGIAINGGDSTLVSFRALIGLNDGFASGTPAVKFALLNSGSGVIYDQVTVVANGDSGIHPQYVLLKAYVPQSTSGSVRLQITNTSSTNPVTLYTWWQLVSNIEPSAFVPTTTTAVAPTTYWSANGDKARFTDRLSIPYKLDGFGSATASTLDNLTSDIYISSQTNTLNFYNGSAWNQAVAGSKVRQGTATLSSGSISVSDTAVAAGTKIYVGMVTPAGTVGAPFIFTKTNSTGFVIHSTSGTDSSVVSYLEIDP